MAEAGRFSTSVETQAQLESALNPVISIIVSNPELANTFLRSYGKIGNLQQNDTLELTLRSQFGPISPRDTILSSAISLSIGAVLGAASALLINGLTWPFVVVVVSTFLFILFRGGHITKVGVKWGLRGGSFVVNGKRGKDGDPPGR